jgi:hypothetical protein
VAFPVVDCWPFESVVLADRSFESVPVDDRVSAVFEDSPFDGSRFEERSAESLPLED